MPLISFKLEVYACLWCFLRCIFVNNILNSEHLIKSQFVYVCVCVHTRTHVCVHAHMNALNPVKLFATPWTVVHEAPLSMALSRQECWSRLTSPPQGGSSWPRNWTLVSCVSCIAGRFFICWAIKEALVKNQFSKDILEVTHHHTLDLNLSVKGKWKKLDSEIIQFLFHKPHCSGLILWRSRDPDFIKSE